MPRRTTASNFNGVTMFVLDRTDRKIYTYRYRDNASGLQIAPRSATVGQTLTAHTLQVSDRDGVPDDYVFTYRWQREDGDGWQDIPDATDRTYTAQPADGGLKLRVQVPLVDNSGYRQVLSDQVTVLESLWYELDGALAPGRCVLKDAHCVGLGPKDVTPTIEHSGIRLRWSTPRAPLALVVNYEVVRAVGSGVFVQIDCTGGGEFEHFDPDVLDDMGYRYLVRAHYAGSGCESERYTSWAGDRLNRTVPRRDKPEGLQATAEWGANDGSMVVLQWGPPKDPAGLTGYVVIRARGGHAHDWRPGYDTGFPVAFAAEVEAGYADYAAPIALLRIGDLHCSLTKCAYTDRGMANGNAYDYAVRAWRDIDRDDVVDPGELSGYSKTHSFWLGHSDESTVYR